MPSCFPHASDPHTDHTLIQPQPDHAPAETSADGSSGSTPTNSLKFQRPTTGGHGRQGTASLRDATTASASEGPGPASPPEGGPLCTCTVHLTVDIDGSFVLSSTCLPTNGHNHQACAKPVTGSHFRSTNCLPTSGYLHLRRQRQRRCVDNVNVIGPAAGGIAEAWPVKVWRHGRSRRGCRET